MKRGLLITLLLTTILIVSLALVGGYIYIRFNKEPSVPKSSILRIDVRGNIVDSETASLSKKLEIRDLWFHIQRAKIDSRIKGILLRISDVNTPIGKIEDLGRFIKDFRTSGKKVYAMLEDAGIREYYLASFADKVYLFKGGSIFLKGISAEAMFIKKALDKLGIQGDFIHVGEYKTASSMFTRDSMTPFHKEAISQMVNDIFSSTLEGIAQNRNIPLSTVKKIFEESPFTNQPYLDAKLIDGLSYEDEITKQIDSHSSIISFQAYSETTSPSPFTGSSQIAVIFVSGEIHSGKSGGQTLFGGEMLGSETVWEQLRNVGKNPAIKAVVLRIDSPGGSATASEVIRREVELVAKKKPVIVSMSDLAASGGYWIAMGSTEVMALPQTITGSIGVLSGKFVLKGLYDKIGITKEIVTTTKNADIFSDNRLFEPEERAKLEGMMKEKYDEFLKLVAQNRKMSVEDVDKIARGRVWAGISAKNLKLVDQIGGLIDAIYKAKKYASIPANENIGVTIYPKKKTYIDLLMELVGSKTEANSLFKSVEAQCDLYRSFFPAYYMPYEISTR